MSHTTKASVRNQQITDMINTFAKTDRERKRLLWYRWDVQTQTTEEPQKPWKPFYHCSTACPAR